MRARALAGTVTRQGAVIDATTPGLHWLEWSLAEDKQLDDWPAVLACNPARYITRRLLREQAQRLTPTSFAQFRCSRWGVSEGSWLPPGAWSACAGEIAAPDEPVWLGVDIGGARAASAIVGITASLQVALVHVFEGDRAVLQVVDKLVEIAGRRTVVEVAHDPWRFRSEALRLERDHGLTVVEIPMSSSRLCAMSENLHSVVVSRRLTHPADPILDQHVASSIAKQGPRGWRLDKVTQGVQIDAVIALAMAVERCEQQRVVRPTRLVAWV